MNFSLLYFNICFVCHLKMTVIGALMELISPYWLILINRIKSMIQH